MILEGAQSVNIDPDKGAYANYFILIGAHSAYFELLILIRDAYTDYFILIGAHSAYIEPLILIRGLIHGLFHPDRGA